MGSTRRAPIALVLLLGVAACGEDSGDVADSPDQATTKLTVTVRDAPGQPATTWTLTCDPPGGTHPDPGGACRVLASARAPFAPVPADMLCTQVYGGPETATIVGTWRGEPVSASYKRTDGCEIARWEALRTVLAPARPS